MDKTARVWASDQYQSLKLYADHLSDVEVYLLFSYIGWLKVFNEKIHYQPLFP